MAQLPTPGPLAARSEKLDDPKMRQLAPIAWAAPLLGLAVTVALNCAGEPREDLFRAIAGLTVFGACVLIGMVFSILNWTRARRYKGVMGHAVAGVIINLVLVAIVGLVTAGLMTLARAATMAQETGQLKDIHAAVKMYTRDTGGYPETWATLVERGYLEPRSMVMPGQERPAEFKTWPAEQQTTWAVERMRFRFPVLGKTVDDTREWNVIGYMPAEQGVRASRYYVVAAEGEVTVVEREWLEEALEKQGLGLE